jgi:small-conductance mechanosensitive channel
MNQLDSDRSGRLVGVILIVASVLTVVTMAHHPSGHAGALGKIVHGTMIVLLSGMFFGFCYYSMRRGLVRPLILAALVAYLLNYFAHIIAATINGLSCPRWQIAVRTSLTHFS